MEPVWSYWKLLSSIMCVLLPLMCVFDAMEEPQELRSLQTVSEVSLQAGLQD